MTALAEHRLAAQLQNMIQPLPEGPLRLPGVEAMVRYLPAESAVQVGGDWYHAQAFPDGCVVLAIGDVAGHGLGAASGMAHLRYALVAWLSIGIRDPATLLGHLNRLSTQLKITGTAVLAVYEPATHEIRWSRAGHPSPLIARAATVDPLGAPAGLLLGADPDVTYPVATSGLRDNDLVLFYTDGLVERRSVDPARLLAKVRHAMAAASASVDDRSVARLLSELHQPSPYDDTCILAIRVVG
jgi:serine phosphatase RsbU (regulator of sigma subunit)